MRGYSESECRRAEDRILRDLDRIDLVGGGQGREPEEVRESAGIGGWLLLLLVGIVVAVAVMGCSTVSGIGADLQAVSEGVRAEMAKEVP